jgi:protease-4
MKSNPFYSHYRLRRALATLRMSFRALVARHCHQGMSAAHPSAIALRLVLHSAIVAQLFLPGCAEPQVHVQAVGNVTAEVAPTVSKRPVFPTLLPHRPHVRQACLIAVVDVDGVLLDADATGLGSWGENPVALFRERLDAIEHNTRVRAVVLRIHTPGGSVTATDIMWRDLQAFKARTCLPVVACLMDVAAGGGYYLATGAHCVVAHPTTVTGAIGCILNVYNLQDLLAQFNIIGVPVKAGKYVDLGTPVKSLDDESRKLLQQMATEFHQRFRRVVVSSRPHVDPNRETTFDGRVFTASQALELGLIDQIGYLDDAVRIATNMAGLNYAEVTFLHRCGDPALSQYSITPNIPLQNKIVPIRIPGIDRSRLPSFLYLWQIEPGLESVPGP